MAVAAAVEARQQQVGGRSWPPPPDRCHRRDLGVVIAVVEPALVTYSARSGVTGDLEIERLPGSPAPRPCGSRSMRRRARRPRGYAPSTPPASRSNSGPLRQACPTPGAPPRSPGRKLDRAGARPRGRRRAIGDHLPPAGRGARCGRAPPIRSNESVAALAVVSMSTGRKRSRSEGGVAVGAFEPLPSAAAPSAAPSARRRSRFDRCRVCGNLRPLILLRTAAGERRSGSSAPDVRGGRSAAGELRDERRSRWRRARWVGQLLVRRRGSRRRTLGGRPHPPGPSCSVWQSVQRPGPAC